MMKKLSAVLALLVALSLLLCASSSAETITALAIEINPEHLEKTVSYARILGYNEKNNTLTVELITPEVFLGEDIDALQAGDSIYTGGREVPIRSISYDDDWCSTVFFNDRELMLFQDRTGKYTMMADEDNCVWTSFAQIECKVMETLLFMDHIDEQTGRERKLPVVHSAKDLISELQAKNASEAYTLGLSSNNVYVVFDETGNLAAIHRFHYSYWQ